MDELASMLNQFLSSKDGMDQLQGVLSMLQSNAPPTVPPAPPTQTIDPQMIQNLTAMLGVSQNPSTPPQPPAIDPNMINNLMGMFNNSSTNSSPPIDTPSIDPQMINAIMGMLGDSAPSIAQNPIPPSPNINQGLNLDPNMLQGLFSMIGGQQPKKEGSTSLLEGLDLDTIMKIGSAITAVTQQDKNTALLLALKPHFAEERQKKVDDAIRFMQLIKLFPLIKDTGIFKMFGGDDSGTVA